MNCFMIQESYIILYFHVCVVIFRIRKTQPENCAQVLLTSHNLEEMKIENTIVLEVV